MNMTSDSGVPTLRSTFFFRLKTIDRLLSVIPVLLFWIPSSSLSAEPLITPVPRHVRWTHERLPLVESSLVLAVTEQEQQVA
ncbi:MAG: hypothetical protein ACWGQW_23890, partial [bacterium]